MIDSIKNLIKPVLKTRWFLHFPYLCAEVKLHSSFRDEEFHYFTLDLCTGVCPAVWSALERLISTGSSLWPGRVVDFSPQRGMWRESCQVGRALYLPIIFIFMFIHFPHFHINVHGFSRPSDVSGEMLNSEALLGPDHRGGQELNGINRHLVSTGNWETVPDFFG